MVKKKEKNVIDEKLYKQSKLMICVFTFIGVAMVAVILLSTAVNKGTYSISYSCGKYGINSHLMGDKCYSCTTGDTYRNGVCHSTKYRDSATNTGDCTPKTQENTYSCQRTALPNRIGSLQAGKCDNYGVSGAFIYNGECYVCSHGTFSNGNCVWWEESSTGGSGCVVTGTTTTMYSCPYDSTYEAGLDGDAVALEEEYTVTLTFRTNEGSTITSKSCTIAADKQACDEDIIAPTVTDDDFNGWGLAAGCETGSYTGNAAFHITRSSGNKSYYACKSAHTEDNNNFDKNKCGYTGQAPVTRDEEYRGCSYINIQYNKDPNNTTGDTTGYIHSCCTAAGGIWVGRNFTSSGFGYEYCVFCGSGQEEPASAPACYLVNHKYVWATEKPTGGVKVTTLTTEAKCKGCEDGYEEVNGTCVEPSNPTENPTSKPNYACYLVNHKYIWAKSKPTGGTLVTTITTSDECDGCVDGYEEMNGTCVEPSNPTKAPVKSCYTCTLNGKTQSVYATSTTEAAKGATTLKGVTANNCKAVSDDYCKAIKQNNCYECKETGKNNKYVTAYDEAEAKTKSSYTTCSIVTSNKCNTPTNPQTGTIYIILAWVIGIITIGYSFWYFRKSLLIK